MNFGFVEKLCSTLLSEKTIYFSPLMDEFNQVIEIVV